MVLRLKVVNVLHLTITISFAFVMEVLLNTTPVVVTSLILPIKVQESGKKRRLCALKRNAEAFCINCISA
jgi:hypothetical protein